MWTHTANLRTEELTYHRPSSAGKESSCIVGDPNLIPGSGRFPGERIGYPVQYSWASLTPSSSSLWAARPLALAGPVVPSCMWVCATRCAVQVCCSQRRRLLGRPLQTCASARNTQTLRGRSGFMEAHKCWSG